MKEREAKLAAPPEFDLPPLGGPEDGYAAEPLTARRLSTTVHRPSSRLPDQPAVQEARKGGP